MTRSVCCAPALFVVGLLSGALLTLSYAAGPRGASSHSGTQSWRMTSPAFRPGARIPAKYTADGANVSPALRWTDPPHRAAELALVCHDPDAPVGDWVHWVLYGMPGTLRALPEAVPTTARVARPAGLKQGRNDFGTLGYSGPKPPPGKVHHYHFVLYALDAPVKLKPAATRAELTRAIQGHILRQTELIGTYSR